MKAKQILALLLMLVASSLLADNNNFTGFDVNNEYNIWKRANVKLAVYKDVDCNQMENGYNIHIPKATTESGFPGSGRQAFISLETNLTQNDLIPGEKYDLSFRVRISRPVEELTVYLSPYDRYGNGNPIMFPTFYLGSDTETEYVLFQTEQTAYGFQVLYTMTFSGTTLVDDVDITISDIVLMNHKDNQAKIPNVVWKDLSPFTINNMEYEVQRFSLGTVQLNKVNEPYRNLMLPKTIHHFDADFSIVSIEKEALSNQQELRSLVLPASIRSIAPDAMKGCNGICDIHIQNPIPPYAHPTSFGNIDREQSILYVPIGSKETYATALGWSEFRRIVVEDSTAPEGKICEAPEISYADNALHFYSPTPGAQYHYTIEATDATSSTLVCDGILPLKGTYQIKAFAHAEGYNVSPTVVATLCWLDADTSLSTPIVVDAKPVLIKCIGNTIMIEGATSFSKVEFFAPDGRYLGSEPVIGGCTSFSTTEPLVLIKMGHQTFKVKSGM